MIKYYVLDKNGEPLPSTLMEWAKFFETGARKVASTKVGESHISTVFLGLDHNYSNVGGPLLWETMVFGGKMSEHQERCGGPRKNALAMHKRMVAKVKGKK